MAIQLSVEEGAYVVAVRACLIFLRSTEQARSASGDSSEVSDASGLAAAARLLLLVRAVRLDGRHLRVTE